MQDRHVPLERVLNFRDFGGYAGADGAQVKRGRLFRSAHFSDATEADAQKLNALGIAFLVDLRRPEERSFEPNRWPGAAVRSFSNDEGAGAALPPHLQALYQNEITAESVASYMRQAYRDFPSDKRLISLYRSWFAELAEGEGGAVIHCAAGKDRTGLACALTLHALGVGEADVFADYELTNAILDLDQRLPRIQARMEARVGRQLGADVLRPMLGVNVDYLREAFAVIDAKHGTRDAYLRDVLGVGDAARARLREKLLA